MALTDTVSNRLKAMITDPSSYAGSTGYSFAKDQAMQAAQRGMSSQRGSGNVLAELSKLGSGLASQDYGNEFSRMAGLLGQEQGNDQATARLGLDTTVAGNNFTLGKEQNANTNTNNWMDYALGLGRNTNDAQRTANDWGLGMAGAQTNWLTANSNDAARRNTTAQNWWETFN